MNAVTREQASVAHRYGVDPVPAPAGLKVGISRNVREGALPLNGLRHVPEVGTTGWFIWGGEELSDDADFFVPLHVEHLEEWCPQVLPYLALPAGWRFLLAPDYADVWFDEDLL